MIIENNGNFVSKRQFGLLFIQISLPFKIAMMPSLLSASVGRDAIIAVSLLALTEIIAAVAVFGICKAGGLMKLYKNSKGVQKAVILILMLAVSAFSAFKFVLNTAEFLDYVSLTLFDDVGWTFIIVTLLPILFALTRSKGNVGGRCAMLCGAIFGTALFLSLLFNKYKLDQPLRPLIENGFSPVLGTLTRFSFHCFDFLPLCFIAVKASPNESQLKTHYLSFAFYGVLLILFYYVAQRTYGNALSDADNLFARIAVYHSITDEIKVFDFPIIVSWLISALLNQCVLTYGVKSLSISLLNRDILSPVFLLSAGAVLLFAVGGSHQTEKFFSTLFWNVSALVTAAAIIAFYIFVKIHSEKTNAR